MLRSPSHTQGGSPPFPHLARLYKIFEVPFEWLLEIARDLSGGRPKESVAKNIVNTKISRMHWREPMARIEGRGSCTFEANGRAVSEEPVLYPA